jgi:hypothetical protein
MHLRMVAILLLETLAAHSQSLTTRAALIARDVAVNMAASAAFSRQIIRVSPVQNS